MLNMNKIDVNENKRVESAKKSHSHYAWSVCFFFPANFDYLKRKLIGVKCGLMLKPF